MCMNQICQITWRLSILLQHYQCQCAPKSQLRAHQIHLRSGSQRGRAAGNGWGLQNHSIHLQRDHRIVRGSLRFCGQYLDLPGFENDVQRNDSFQQVIGDLGHLWHDVYLPGGRIYHKRGVKVHLNTQSYVKDTDKEDTYKRMYFRGPVKCNFGYFESHFNGIPLCQGLWIILTSLRSHT